MACSAGSSPAVGASINVGLTTRGPGQQQLSRLGIGGSLELPNAGGNIMASSLSPADDIIKMGILRKGKKGRKRWFVLHQETYGKPSRLDCYESEKHFCKSRSSSGGAGGHPLKLSIPMKTCFNVNKHVDNKLKHCVALFTMDDVLLLGCENEQEQEAWLQTLLTVVRNTKGGFGQDDSSRLNYDHVWDVTILRDRGLTEKNPSLSGQYRLCMTHAAIFLYRKGEDVHSLEFPLVFIASYGCKASLWFLRVGRTAMTGSGELTMETEDPVIAANINETMKSILEENHDQRQRSGSTSMGSSSLSDRRQGWGGRSGSTTAASMLSSSSSAAASSTSLERSGSIINPQSRSRAISESEKTLQSIMQNSGSAGGSTSSLCKPAMTRKVSAPLSSFKGDHFALNQQHGFGMGSLASPKKMFRKMTTGSMSLRSHLAHPRGSGVHPVNIAEATGSSVLGSTSTLSAASSATVSPVSPLATTMGGGLFAGRTIGYSPALTHGQLSWMPPGQSPLTTGHPFCSTDSVGSGSSSSDHDHGVARYLHRQATADRAPSKEVVSNAIAEESSGSGAEYLPMQAGGGDDTVSKSTTSSRASSTSTVLMLQRSSQPPQDKSSGRCDTYVDMGSNAASGDRRRMTADSGYLEMHRANTATQLPTSTSSDHVAGLSGYTPMGPGSVGRSSSSAHSRQTSWHLEEVRSYISDSDNSSCSQPPSRAWSLGSRPAVAGEVIGTGANYTAMGPAAATPSGLHSATPSSTGPMSKFGLFLTGRLGSGVGSADDRKRAHSVGSWNKPPWKRNLAASVLTPADAAVSPPSGYADQNAPSTSSSFYRPRSESFGSARSTPGSRRLMDSGGSKLSNQSEDLVEMEFGRSSIGRSPSGSLGSSDSISRSRASSLGGGGAGGVHGNNAGGASGPSSMFGRQPWSPRVEQITEDNINSPSGKLIQLFQQQLAAGGGGVLSEEYVPMGPNDSDYCAMTLGGPASGTAATTAIIPRSQPADEYVAMSLEPRHNGGRSGVTRQFSNPSNNNNSAASSYDTAATDSTATMRGPIRHGSGSSNLSLGNSNCMGLDSGVGGSSFSLDQQKSDHAAHHHSQQQQPSAGAAFSKPVSVEQRARSSTSLSPMEQLKERLARVEMAGGCSDTRRATDDDAYMPMDVAPKKSAGSSMDSNAVRRSSSFAKTGSLTRPSATTQKPTIENQSPSTTTRSPIFKMFASFGKGSSKQQQPSPAPTTAPPPVAAVIAPQKSPTPSLKSVPSAGGSGDSRSRTPSASSKISLTDFGATKPQQKLPAIVTNSSTEAEAEPPAQLEYASLDLQQPGNPSPTGKTPSPRPSSSCSVGAETVVAKLSGGAPAVMVNDGVVYAQIDPARTTDAKAIPSRQH